MVAHIGQTVTYNGIQYHIQDVNNISKTANIGRIDINGIVWDSFWVDWDDLQLAL
jgi:hypothetical protein